MRSLIEEDGGEFFLQAAPPTPRGLRHEIFHRGVVVGEEYGAREIGIRRIQFTRQCC